MKSSPDVVVIGAGIVGLGVALAAKRQGFDVIVLDRSAEQRGASIRNFGFVTVTGQERGRHWQRARRSAQIWSEIAPKAGIPICHRGLLLACQRPEATAVIEAFMQTEMGEGCQQLTPAECVSLNALLIESRLDSGLYSPYEVRVESREAVGQLTEYLRRLGVVFRFSEAAIAVEGDTVLTSRGARINAARIVVCPGPDLVSLYPEWIAARRVELCTLQMFRVTGARKGSFQSALMSDLSLVRYAGYAALPEADALRERLISEQPAELEMGIHLIAVQSLDGSLVVGDSHVYGAAENTFSESRVDALIFSELQRLLQVSDLSISERWLGTYPSSEIPCFIDSPDGHVRLVMVTGGTGASTAFALGEETMESFGCNI